MSVEPPVFGTYINEKAATSSLKGDYSKAQFDQAFVDTAQAR
jgi:hypothetical protein